jgi:hypothetical protein
MASRDFCYWQRPLPRLYLKRFLLRVLRWLFDGPRRSWIGHRPSRLLPGLCVDCGKRIGRQP